MNGVVAIQRLPRFLYVLSMETDTYPISIQAPGENAAFSPYFT